MNTILFVFFCLIPMWIVGLCSLFDRDTIWKWQNAIFDRLAIPNNLGDRNSFQWNFTVVAYGLVILIVAFIYTTQVIGSLIR
jgi:hypothetical protein